MRLLSKDQIEWLKTLPTKVWKEIAGRKFYLVHGSPRNPFYGLPSAEPKCGGIETTVHTIGNSSKTWTA